MSTTDVPAEFEADLEPGTGFPRLRFNFDNGWSASLLIRAGIGRTVAMMASVACAPVGQWSKGLTELLATDAFADEAMILIDQVRQRPFCPMSADEAVEALSQ